MNTTKPKQQRSIISRNKILEAATELFASNGPDGTRVDEIEAKSGVNKQRIYAYFGSKDKLYRRVLLKVYAQAAEHEKLLQLSPTDIPNMTNAIINCFFDFHKTNPLFWRLLAWENLKGGTSLSKDDWKDIQSDYIQHLQHLYELGQEKDFFDKKITFSTYLISIFAITFFYYSNQMTISHLLSLDMDTPDFKSKFVDEIQMLFKKAVHTDQH